MNTLLIIGGIYFFVLIGFIAKRTFQEISERTLILLSIYFLQPMLAFWGILDKPFTLSDFAVPAWYFAISVIGAILSFGIFSTVLKDKRDVAVVSAAGVIGNTGNLGVPLLIGLYGKSVAFYAVLINTANVFILYIVGVFLYSLGNFSAKDAVKNIFKIPVIWFSLLAILLHTSGVSLHPSIEKTLEMGAYASMTLQLIIFGVFIGGLLDVKIEKTIVLYGLLNKVVLIPALAFCMLLLSDLEPFLKMLVFLQICMPLAVSNINLASLYECKPYNVTALILSSSIVFLGAFFIYSTIEL